MPDKSELLQEVSGLAYEATAATTNVLRELRADSFCTKSVIRRIERIQKSHQRINDILTQMNIPTATLPRED